MGESVITVSEDHVPAFRAWNSGSREISLQARNGENMSKGLPAMYGGVAVREGKKALPYAHQDINEDDIRAVDDVLRSDYVTTGPAITAMEDRLKELTGAKYVAAVSNGTSALHVACMAAGVGEGDEVITTPITFAASANCALYCGARPVFADIDPETWEIDPRSVGEKLTDHTKAVVPVDYTGQTPELDAVRKLCDDNGLIMIEDAAHSLGTTYKGRLVGSIADLTTFSFHAIKTVTGGEGGAVATDDEEMFRKLLLYRTHGITRDPVQLVHGDSETAGKPDPWYYEMQALAMNYRITDIQAALITSQLNRLGQFASRRKAIKKRYDEAFRNLPQLILQKCPGDVDAVRHLYVLRLNPDKLSVSRREFFDALVAEGVGCNVNYIPVYWFPYYEKLGYRRGLCPNAESLYENMLSIPFYSAMTDSDVQDVIDAVTRLCEYYADNL